MSAELCIYVLDYTPEKLRNSYNKHMRVCLISIQTLANRWNKKMSFNQDFFLNITMTDKSLLPSFRCR